MRDREKERNIRLPESYVQQGGPVRPPRPSRARRAAPVSYTHLGPAAKIPAGRQGGHSMQPMEKNVEKQLVVRTFEPDMNALKQTAKPVSYTHLDVYKRQAPGRPLRLLQTPRSARRARPAGRTGPAGTGAPRGCRWGRR